MRNILLDLLEAVAIRWPFIFFMGFLEREDMQTSQYVWISIREASRSKDLCVVKWWHPVHPWNPRHCGIDECSVWIRSAQLRVSLIKMLDIWFIHITKVFAVLDLSWYSVAFQGLKPSAGVTNREFPTNSNGELQWVFIFPFSFVLLRSTYQIRPCLCRILSNSTIWNKTYESWMSNF
jgi:hypothetical protein